MGKSLSYLLKMFVLSGLFCCWLNSQTHSALAQTIIVSDTVPAKTTNWSDSLMIPAFSPAMGQLTAVTLTLETPITGLVSYENTSSKPAVITSTHAVSIYLDLLDGQVINSTPSITRLDVVPAYDGQADYAGTSGATFTLNTSLLITRFFTTPAALAQFYGHGLLTFPIRASGASNIEGPGNFNAILRAQAAGATFALYFAYLPLDFEVKKLTNGVAATDPDGVDLPVVAPGDPIVWHYEVRNTGQANLTLADLRVTDSDPTLTPQFDPTSDNGDGILTPGERWRYIATGVAHDLSTPPPSVTVVNGCLRLTQAQPGRAYENTAIVAARGLTETATSHYCNPLVPPANPGLVLAKFTNGRRAVDPNGIDVPVVMAGAPITWTYLVTNTGDVTFTLAELTLTDSDNQVQPTFDPTSDDGDRLLAPGERWRYRAYGIAQDLRTPTAGTTVVNGCRWVSPTEVKAYENMATVQAQGITKTALSHYCNPDMRALTPGIELRKLINGQDADRPDDPDVPLFLPGAPIVWTYIVTNTGSLSFTLAALTITDDDRTLTVEFDPTSDDGDGMLAPDESWRFFAQGIARNLFLNSSGITVVNGCDPNKTGNKSLTYRNIGTVQVGALVEQDPSHYCNLPPTGIGDNHDRQELSKHTFLPLIAR